MAGDKAKLLQQHSLGIDCLLKNSPEKNLCVLVDKLNRNQTHGLTTTKTHHTLDYASQTVASRLREVTIPFSQTL